MLQAKLCKPYIGRNIIRRKKVEDALCMLPDYRIALISAPAGYGKTISVVDYLTRNEYKYAWFSIDEDDNDPVSFWRYLLASVARCIKNDDIGRISLDLELVSSNITVDLLIDTIETVCEEFIIVLDDYHLIKNKIILSSIEHFMKYMPQTVSVIILSRNEPEPMLSALRLRGRTISLGIKELCFDCNEIAQYYAKIGYDLTEKEINILMKSTEGWAAGLVAASFSIREHENIDSAICSFSGMDKNINQILENEIFDYWSGEVKDFLIHTSFLDKLSGSVCSAVTGNKNSAGLLKKLSGSNGFIIPLDNENQWFRYHNLFREFLLGRLELEGEPVLQRLYRFAGEWYLGKGFHTEGIDWLLKAGEYEKALPYIMDFRYETSQDVEFIKWNGWIDSIPEQLYENDIIVYTSYSWVASMDNKPGLAQAWAKKALECFERIKSGLQQTEKDYLEACVLLSEINVALLHMDITEAKTHFSRLSQLELELPVMLGELNWNEPSLLKTAYGFKGRLSKVKEYLTVMKSLPRMIGDFASYFSMLIAESYYEQNKLTELNKLLISNMGTITEISNPGILVPCFITLAKERLAKGDIPGAVGAIDDAKKILAGKVGNVWQYHLDVFTTKLYLNIGDMGNALKLLNPQKIGIYDKLSCVREPEYIVYARYLVQINCLEKALIILSRLAAFASKESRLGSQIEIICLTAICHSKKGDYENALAALGTALSLGYAHEYTRTFVDELEPMAALLERYILVNRNGYKNEYLTYAKSLFRDTNDYIKILRSAINTDFDKRVPLEDYSGSLLSKRELEILKLLADKKSNEEIAKELFLSLSTIKQHNSRMYDKLGVKNRHELTIRAKKLRIIE